MQKRVDGNPIHILLVEDDPDDIEITMETLERSKVKINMDVTRDGLEALKYLRKESPFENAPSPDLILMDINLPGMKGTEVLATIKNDPKLQRIPVAILTSSTAEEDILAAYDHHANCYLTKPVGMKEFMKMVTVLEEFWFTLVRLPRNKND